MEGGGCSPAVRRRLYHAVANSIPTAEHLTRIIKNSSKVKPIGLSFGLDVGEVFNVDIGGHQEYMGPTWYRTLQPTM